MRLFCFSPFHISSIQNGIQSLHASHELVNKYPRNKDVKKWRFTDKTVILKNGGDSPNIKRIVRLFNHKDNKFPWATFREPDLNNLMTSVCILLPDELDKVKPWEKSLSGSYFGNKLIKLMKETRLAT